MKSVSICSILVLTLGICIFSSCKKEEANLNTSKSPENVHFTLQDDSKDEPSQHSLLCTYTIENSEALKLRFYGSSQHPIGYSEQLTFRVSELKVGTFVIGQSAEFIFTTDGLFSSPDHYSAAEGSINITRISSNNRLSGEFFVYNNGLPLVSQDGFEISGTFESVGE